MVVNPDETLGAVCRSQPILGICGRSGCGKTTLIEALLPHLLDRGLRVAVLKHNAHRILVDTPGKDSDRLFQAGADVWLDGETPFFRSHRRPPLIRLALELAARYDLVLVEGHQKTDLPRLWLQNSPEESPPAPDPYTLKTVSCQDRRVEYILPWLNRWLTEQLQQQPVLGCVLIGGRSSRMGQPKHLIREENHTWLERSVTLLSQVSRDVVLSGRGEIPDTLTVNTRIPDAPGSAGPLAGILSIMRWQPAVSWLVVGCDQPAVRKEALEWLLSLRSPATLAILPSLDGHTMEPLLAYYDRKCRPLLEELACQGLHSLKPLSGQDGILSPRVPEYLRSCWDNINTPEQLAARNNMRKNNIL